MHNKMMGLAFMIAAFAMSAAAQTTVTNSNNGVSGQVPVYSGAATLGSGASSPISVSGSNVGIGTTNPAGPLEIRSNSNGIGMRHINSLLDAGYCDYCYQYLKLFVIPTATSNEPLVTVAGRITIGRSDDIGVSASSIIYASRGWDNNVRYSVTQLSGSSPLSIVQMTDGGVNYVAVLLDTHTGAGAEFWSLDLDVQDSNDTKVALAAKSSSTAIHSALPHPITPNIVLGNGGNNVGIGTTNPTFPLTVNGNISSTGYCLNGSNCITSWPTAGTNTWTSAQTFSASTMFPGSGIWNASGNVGIGTTNPAATLQVAGNSYSLSNLSGEKEFSFNFPNGVANQKVDLYMTGIQVFAGSITVDVTDTYANQNAAGMVSRRFALGFNPNNSIWENESYYIEDSGTTSNNWAISGLSWDATNSRYKITLVHLVSTGNLPSVHITAFAVNGQALANFLTFTAGSIYTTDPTVYGRPYISFNNNVGIGTTAPGAMLEVDGNVKLTANSGASITFQDGTTQSTAYTGVTCGGDYAESVDVAGDRKNYEPGDVLVIAAESGSDVLKSAEPYSTLVAGIYSTKPGTVGRRQTTDAKASKTEVPMAMVGIVPAKVNAENGPIKRGDLLVTSSTVGYAMKGTDRSRMFGAVIGKAMGNLNSGTGVIEVLVTLQ